MFDDLERAARTLTPQSGRLESDAREAEPIFRQSWDALGKLPPRSQRDAASKQQSARLVDALADLCSQMCRTHRAELYDALTDGRRRAVRVDDLLWLAAERWPGLVPTRSQLTREAERLQGDKDGLEIQQGRFVSELLSDPAVGLHLIGSMLEPTTEAESKLDELVATGSIDLGTVRVSVREDAGYLFFRHPRFLNAEDDATLGPLEIGVDLLLLHPGVKLGVLRGDPVTHPKYANRRIFSAGINLTKLYRGKVPFLFYLVRELGAVHKLYRGIAVDPYRADVPETTTEKPWMAVVDGFAIGGGCQLLLVMDRVIAEEGAYLSLPARKEGIIPGAANLRLSRFVGEAVAREAILFDRRFDVSEPAARGLVHEVHAPASLDTAVEQAVRNAVGSGMVSAAGNRRALRVQSEPLDLFRRYMATYARDQASCHLSEQLSKNLEQHWQAKTRTL